MGDPDFQEDPDSFRYPPTTEKQKPRRNIWQRLSIVVEGVIYVLIVLIVIRLFQPELDRERELRLERDRLEEVRLEKEERVARLRREHLHLKSDRQFLETVARDRLNLQRAGEYVIRIER